MRRLILLLLLLVATTAGAQTSDTIRVCTWNVLNFDQNVDSSRVVAVQTVIRAIQPDILVVQGVAGPSGFDNLSSQVQKAVAPRVLDSQFEDGPDTDNAIFYDSTKLRRLGGGGTINTNLRDINEWILVAHASSEDTIHLFGCHFRTGNTAADSIERNNEAVLVRQRMEELEALPFLHHWIVAGNLNTYSSTEGAFQELTTSPVERGIVYDPLDRLGDWHADSAFGDIYTQSTRVRQFGGGIGGGLADRFDFVLISIILWQANRYRWGSYTTFGNDGRHFNDSINALPNMAVPDSIAEALHVASDHLPVYLDLMFPKIKSGVDTYRGPAPPELLSIPMDPTNKPK